MAFTLSHKMIKITAGLCCHFMSHTEVVDTAPV